MMVKSCFLLPTTLALLLLAALPAAAQFYNSAEKNTSNSASIEWRPSVAWGGVEFGVAWYRQDSIRFASVDENGNLAAGPGAVHQGNASVLNWRIGLVYTGTHFVLAFTQKLGNYWQVYLLRVDDNGQPIAAAVRVSANNYNCWRPALAWSGSELGLAYKQDDGSKSKIVFQRFKANLAKVGQVQEVYSSAKYLEDTNVVWSGKYYAVLWTEDNKSFLLQRLNANGSKKKKTVTVFVSGNQYAPGDPRLVLRDGGAYALAFRWQEPGSAHINIYFLRLKSKGKRIGQPLRVSRSANAYAYEPALVFDALQKKYAVFWIDNRDAPQGSNLYATKLNQNGAVIVSDVRLTANQQMDRWPAAAGNGDVALLAFTRQSIPNSGQVYTIKMIEEAW